ncbi:MAG: cyclase [Deltaproteobacteria bacterium]|nr:cyclase [Deltaproteobacteria bacterium]MBZ0220181.1 cyclase [Deltaproteobacteria bacterium]
MAYLLIEHDVTDFDRWKPVYDGHEDRRRQAGLKEVLLLQDIENPKKVVLLFEAADLKKAREFLESDDLQKTMQRAGVVGIPSFFFLDRPALRKAA